MKKIALVVATLTTLAMAATVFAENKAETITYAPYIGGYTYQGSQHLRTAPVYGFRMGYNLTENWALEGVIDFVHTKSSANGSTADMLRYGGDVLYNFMPKSSLVPYLAAGAGGVNFNGGGVSRGSKAMFNYGGGVKWFIKDDFALRADVRGVNYSYGQIYTNVEYTLGLHIAVGAPKPAPKPIEPPPEPAKPVEPKPAPLAKLNANPASVEKGKAVTLSWNSQNASGCEIQPGVGPVATQGSTEVVPAADTAYTLTCKGEGGSASSAASVAVTQPPKAEEGGGKKASAAGTRLTLNIQFDTGKSDIKKKYFDELKKVGDVLNEQKNIKGVIEGHTDTVGSRAMNMKLSQRRADAVRAYIVKNFKVDRKRIAAKGYGPDKPVADNATAEGRQQNRRIDAVFEEIPNFKPDADEQPAPVQKKVVKKKVAKKKAPAKK